MSPAIYGQQLQFKLLDFYGYIQSLFDHVLNSTLADVL